VKVLLVSPYPPRRDGIAVHTRHLVQHLQTMHDVEVLTQPDRGSDSRADGNGGVRDRSFTTPELGSTPCGRVPARSAGSTRTSSTTSSPWGLGMAG